VGLAVRNTVGAEALLSSPSSPALAGAQGAVVATFFLILGWLVADAVLGGRATTEGVRPVGLAFFGACLFSLAVMLAHIATRGLVLASPWLVRAITGVVFAVLAVRKLIARRRAGARKEEAAEGKGPRGRVAWLLGLMVAAGLLVWGSPVVRSPLTLGGDTSLHAGWASQLLNGEAIPSAPLTGDIPNFYPWLFHSIVAVLARLTPGGRPFHALVPMQLCVVAGILLALFELGRAVGRNAASGAAASLFAGFTGGFGFVLLRGLDVVMDPRSEALIYSGDLLFRRSYNVAFAGLAPPLPREVGLAMLVAFLLLLVTGLQGGSPRALPASGAALGLAGLAGAESLFLGLGVAVVAVFFPAEVTRGRVAASVLVPALAIYALWIVPQAINYFRLGGYVNLTVVGPIALPPSAILISWGVVTPFAIYGIIRWLPKARFDAGARTVLAVTGIGLIFIATSIGVGALLDRAFTALGRPHRYWPLVSLGVALYAALGAGDIIERLAAGRKWLAALLAFAVIGVAVPSPVVASVALPRELSQFPLLDSAVEGATGSLLNLLISGPGERCTAAVPLDLDSQIWAYTGYRLVMYTWELPHPGNRARIRWRDIEEQITPERQRFKDNRVLVEGAGSAARWRRVAKRYDVDMVVVPDERAAAPELRPYPQTSATDVAYTVVRLTRCGV